MPATEQTYRNQKALHIVFAATSIAMTLVTVWMIMADHLRPWKQVQRSFQKIESAKLQAQEDEKREEVRKSSQARLDELQRQIDAVRQREASNARQIADLDQKIKTIRGTFQKLDTVKRFKKAELDSFRSLYDGMIDRDERRQALRYLRETIEPTETAFNEISREFERAERALYEATLQRNLLGSTHVEVADPPPPGSLAEQAGFKAGDRIAVDEFDRMRKAVVAVLRGNSAPQAVRVSVSRAGSDNVSLSFSVQPIPEPSRPEDDDAAWLAFGLTPTPLTSEVLAKRQEDLTREADRVARTLRRKEQEYGGGEGIWGPVNSGLAWVRGLPVLDLAAPPTKIQQISLPELTINYNFKDVPRYDRCTTCHMGIDRVGYDTTADGRPMPLVYHSHPHLTSGATAVNPKGEVVTAGLYLDSNGPHPINAFGCTICHGGQGSGTSFTYASHTPNDLHQAEEWHHDLDWHKVHHWDEPMLPKRFLESSCLKCHHMVTDLQPHQAPKLLEGYKRITRYGCTGCHTIGAEGSIGPDLTDNRPVGPNLKHVASKTSPEWMRKWLKNPHAFRPDSRMPRFYGLDNNDHASDWSRNHAEIHALTHYLFTTSTVPPFTDVPEQGDPTRGKQLFLEKGCLACHSDRAYTIADLTPSLLKTLDPVAPMNPAYKPNPDALYEPETFPEAVRQYARAEFGPNLSSMAAKFPSLEQGYTWLANWIKAPDSYHPKSLMPNLQLAAQDAADIAAWILSSRGDWSAGSDSALWPVAVDVPPVEDPEVSAGLDELMKLFLSKSKVYNERTVLLSEVDSFIATLSRDEKLMYVGERTISRMGCFGCHNINGFDGAKPIGTSLDGWGIKAPAKLDYAHINEFLVDNAPDETGSRDGTDAYYQEQLSEQTRAGFLFQKLHRPRSYDYRKDRDDLKAWDDRLRMPQFAWADDPKAVEEVMTFVLGLTGEKIPARYLPKTHYGASQLALAEGERLLERYNCRGCHVLSMPRYTIAAGANLDRVFKSDDPADANPFLTNVNLSYDNRSKDHMALFPGLTFQPGTPPTLTPQDNVAVTLEGMPIGEDVQEDDQGRPERTLYLQLWKPVTIRGFTFGIGDTVRLDPDSQQLAHTPAEGGDFAWLYATMSAEESGEPFGPFWNRLPPPLNREGTKVQTPWLTNFFQDPLKIRPQAMLRMPRFHFGTPVQSPNLTPEAIANLESTRIRSETTNLANFFAARDGAVFPYQDIPQREQAYLAERETLFGDTAGTTPVLASKYLGTGYTLITKNQCVQCHAFGQFRPTGEENTHGPNLRMAASRLRPEFLLQWIANPTRANPYTAMPQVFPPPSAQASTPAIGVPPELEDKPFEQILAVRDTLLNYVTAVEQELATVAPPPPAATVPAASAPAPAGAPGSGQ